MEEVLKVVGGTEFNPWNTEKDGPASREGGARRMTRSSTDYDPDEFYVRSTNKHDHSERARVRLPGDVLAELSSLVASGEVPEYRTVSDVIRDALVHRLKYLAEMGDNETLMRWVQMEMRQARVEQQDREQEKFDVLVKSWKARVDSAKAALDDVALDRARELIEEDIDWVREPYRGRLVDIRRSMG